jgi:putative DNA primase/helicase
VLVHGARRRYCSEWGKGLAWDGQRWAVGADNDALHLASKVSKGLRRLASELLAEVDPETPVGKWCEAIRAHALKGETQRHLRAVVGLARGLPDVAVDASELDADQWVLNVQNGTIDLRTGELIPHDPKRLCTKLAPVAFDAKAACPIWERFLAEVHRDAETVAYLQQVFGYSLSGDVQEQKFWVHQGTGRNGKGVTFNALAAMLGDYVCVLPAKVLIASKADRHPTEIASLHGARLVMASEAPRNASYNEALIKSLTGGDRLTARRMREDFWTFAPTGKLHLQLNYDLVHRIRDPFRDAAGSGDLSEYPRKLVYEHLQQLAARGSEGSALPLTGDAHLERPPLTGNAA